MTGRIVGEGNVLEVNRATGNVQRRCIRLVGDRRGHDERRDAVPTGAQLVVELGNALAEVVGGLEQRARQRRDHHEVARADDPVHPEI